MFFMVREPRQVLFLWLHDSECQVLRRLGHRDSAAQAAAVTAAVCDCHKAQSARECDLRAMASHAQAGAVQVMSLRDFTLSRGDTSVPVLP